MTNQNTDDEDKEPKNYADLIKLIVTIGCVVVGVCNIVIFPLIDALLHTNILKNELPVLQILIQLIKP